MLQVRAPAGSAPWPFTISGGCQASRQGYRKGGKVNELGSRVEFFPLERPFQPIPTEVPLERHFENF